ncbi:hypothetical protein BDR26DRAFT_920678 [Obelidium mucronatum]|nr:hypothetical protein BDR26DRAFT_920678 [Obelidium mucronatum]
MPTSPTAVTTTTTCSCSNIRISSHTDDNGKRVVDEKHIQVPPVALDLADTLVCLNCGDTLSTDGLGPETEQTEQKEQKEPSKQKEKETTSQCFGGIAVGPPPTNQTPTNQTPTNQNIRVGDKHARRLALRQTFAAFKDALLSDAEERILRAQAECAWLCDRIQAAGGECETASTWASVSSSTASTASNQVIAKEPLASSSSAPGSLLSQHLSSGRIGATSPPSAILASAAYTPGIVSSGSNSASRENISSSGSVSRKVHFKELTSATNNDPTTQQSTKDSSNVPPNKKLHDLKTGFGGSGGKSMPSPAAPNNAKVVFGKTEDMFSLDEGSGIDTDDDGADKYLTDEIEEEEDEEEEDTSPIHNVSLLSSSLPVNIIKDPRTNIAYERKPKPAAADSEFIAPHEIAAKSYQAQSGISGSVVGKMSASYKKSGI